MGCLICNVAITSMYVIGAKISTHFTALKVFTNACSLCYLKHDDPWLIALSKVQFHFAQTYRINNDFTKWFRWQPAQLQWDEWGGSGNSPRFAETALMFLLLLLFWIQALLSYWAPHHLTRFYDVSHMKRCCCFNTAQAIVALFGAVSGHLPLRV